MHLRFVPAAVVALALGLEACAGAPSQKPVKGGPVDQGPGSIVSARAFLEGRWTLESFEVYPPGKPPITLKGSGTLSYDEFGNLKMDIRADQTSSDVLRAAAVILGLVDGVSLQLTFDPTAFRVAEATRFCHDGGRAGSPGHPTGGRRTGIEWAPRGTRRMTAQPPLSQNERPNGRSR